MIKYVGVVFTDLKIPHDKSTSLTVFFWEPPCPVSHRQLNSIVMSLLCLFNPFYPCWHNHRSDIGQSYISEAILSHNSYVGTGIDMWSSLTPCRIQEKHALPPCPRSICPLKIRVGFSASKMEVSVRAISHSKGRFLFVFALQDQVIPGFSFDGPKGITSSCCLRSDMVMAGCLGFHHVLHGATALPCALARSTRCKSCVDALRKQVPANLDLTGKLVLFMIKIVLGNLIKDWELTGTPCMDWYRSIMIYI